MIYFVTARSLGAVKIGFSADPQSRFSKMRTDSPAELRLERVCAGDVRFEKSLHEQFKEFRRSGEWFELSEKVEAFMATIPPVLPKRDEMTLPQRIVAATGVRRSYVSQMLSDKYPHQITIPIAISVFRDFGDRIGPLELATDDEIETLEKFCGRYEKRGAA